MFIVLALRQAQGKLRRGSNRVLGLEYKVGVHFHLSCENIERLTAFFV